MEFLRLSSGSPSDAVPEGKGSLETIYEAPEVNVNDSNGEWKGGTGSSVTLSDSLTPYRTLLPSTPPAFSY